MTTNLFWIDSVKMQKIAKVKCISFRATGQRKIMENFNYIGVTGNSVFTLIVNDGAANRDR